MHDQGPPTAITLRDAGIIAVPVPMNRPAEFACTRDPDRWTTTADEGAKALCRACPRRWLCAKEACKTPGAEGVWAGIRIPEAGRARQFALKQLRSLAEHNGFPVRPGEDSNVA
jgi:WhiB family transcriptional regulator, redox-sensing transcriptional regulator